MKLPSLHGRVDVKALLQNLHSMGLDSVLLEGGSMLNASCFEAGVIDKVIMYLAPKILGGENALTPVGGKGIDVMKDAISVRLMSVRRIGEDICIEGYLNEKNRKD